MSEPHEAVRLRTQQLKNLHAATRLLKRALRFLSALRRLRAQEEILGLDAATLGAGGGGGGGGGGPGKGAGVADLRELAKAAQSLQVCWVVWASWCSCAGAFSVCGSLEKLFASAARTIAALVTWVSEGLGLRSLF